MTRVWLSIGVAAGYALLMWMNPLRASLRDGLRALQRYPALWVIFGFLGFGYACFDLAIGVLAFGDPFVWSRSPFRPEWSWFAGISGSLWHLPPGAAAAAARGAILPMLDGAAGLFNNLVSTFPLAVAAAVALLLNLGGRQVVLLNALRKRFGRAGWIFHGGVLLCALATAAKPLLIFLHRSVDSQSLDQWAQVGAWLAFLFEYLFGIYIQVYLILLAYCWVRGISFTRSHLLDFAIRRSSFVLRWAGIVLLLSTLLIDLPLILRTFAFSASWLPRDEETMNRHLTFSRFVLDGVLILFATTQITLVFHSESLLGAWRNHAKFLAGNFPVLAWFLVTAGVHLYLLNGIDLTCRAAFGEGTAAWTGWRLLFPWIAGAISGWLLASWVCVFRRCDEGRDQSQEWIRF